MGGKSEIYHNCVTSNKLNLKTLDTLSESAERFWELETFDTQAFTEKRTKDCKSAWKLSKKDGTQSLFSWLIVKRAKTSSSFNRDLPIMRLKSLENKFKKEPTFHETYKSTMKDYINKTNPISHKLYFLWRPKKRK